MSLVVRRVGRGWSVSSLVPPAQLPPPSFLARAVGSASTVSPANAIFAERVGAVVTLTGFAMSTSDSFVLAPAPSCPADVSSGIPLLIDPNLLPSDTLSTLELSAGSASDVLWHLTADVSTSLHAHVWSAAQIPRGFYVLCASFIGRPDLVQVGATLQAGGSRQ